MEYTQEQIKNRFEKLPEDVKAVLSSMETTDLIVEIGRKNNLHVDQIGELVDETGLLMMGLKSSNRFADNVKERLGISPEQTEKIVAEINQNVLLKIRDSVRKIHEEHSREDFVEDPLRPAEMVNSPIKDTAEEISEEGEILERNSLLGEIENPERIGMEGGYIPTEEPAEEPIEEPVVQEPDRHNVNMVRNMEESLNYIKNSEKLEKPEPIQPEINTQKVDMSSQEVATENRGNIVEKKLTEVTKIPTQEKEIKTDPYREPVN